MKFGRTSKAWRRRGQSKTETVIGLALLFLAGLGAWALYREDIIATTKAMVSFTLEKPEAEARREAD